jgi:hypothetical protein
MAGVAGCNPTMQKDYADRTFEERIASEAESLQKELLEARKETLFKRVQTQIVGLTIKRVVGVDLQTTFVVSSDNEIAVVTYNHVGDGVEIRPLVKFAHDDKIVFMDRDNRDRWAVVILKVDAQGVLERWKLDWFDGARRIWRTKTGGMTPGNVILLEHDDSFVVYIPALRSLRKLICGPPGKSRSVGQLICAQNFKYNDAHQLGPRYSNGSRTAGETEISALQFKPVNIYRGGMYVSDTKIVVTTKHGHAFYHDKDTFKKEPFTYGSYAHQSLENHRCLKDPPYDLYYEDHVVGPGASGGPDDVRIYYTPTNKNGSGKQILNAPTRTCAYSYGISRDYNFILVAYRNDIDIYQRIDPSNASSSSSSSSAEDDTDLLFGHIKNAAHTS